MKAKQLTGSTGDETYALIDLNPREVSRQL